MQDTIAVRLAAFAVVVVSVLASLMFYAVDNTGGVTVTSGVSSQTFTAYRVFDIVAPSDPVQDLAHYETLLVGAAEIQSMTRQTGAMNFTFLADPSFTVPDGMFVRLVLVFPTYLGFPLVYNTSGIAGEIGLLVGNTMISEVEYSVYVSRFPLGKATVGLTHMYDFSPFVTP